MLKLLERNIAAIEDRLILLAPPSATSVQDGFENVTFDSHRRDELIREMQQLRGSVYLEDGALARHELSQDGLHQTPEDDRSWLLLMVDPDHHVTGCIWYLDHPNTTSIQSLRVRNSPLAKMERWRDTLRVAVESEIARARRDALRYIEVGGWAVSKQCRCKAEGLLLALAGYSLGRHLGGALFITTATVRHSSSAILRRLGGSSLEVDGTAVPSYFDPKYNCEMELLRFDSRSPNAKYTGIVNLLRDKLRNAAVFASDPIGVSSVPRFVRAPQFRSQTGEPLAAA
jgi:hypothetical protein